MSKFDEILNSSDASDALLGEQIDALEGRMLTKIFDTNQQTGLPSGKTLSAYADELYASYGAMRTYRVGFGGYTEGSVFSNVFGFAEINIRSGNVMTIIVHAANTTANHAIIYKRSKSDAGWGSWYKFTGTAV